jgi:hypothetical protein
MAGQSSNPGSAPHRGSAMVLPPTDPRDMREWRWASANVYECTYCTKENICIKISVRPYTKTLKENVVLFDLFPSLTASQPTNLPCRNKEKKTKTKVVIKVLNNNQLAVEASGKSSMGFPFS